MNSTKKLSTQQQGRIDWDASAAMAATAGKATKAKPLKFAARSYVLIENHADGFQTVYASDGVQALSINRPAISSARCAPVLDQIIDDVLPFGFAEIRNASNIAVTGIQRRLTVAELMQRRERMIEFYAYCSINADRRFSLSNATLEILKV